MGKISDFKSKNKFDDSGGTIVAIASSTGGPKALHEVIPKLPKNINAPVVVVQHMQDGFTKQLADRMNELSELKVIEAQDNMELKKGYVYIAKAGMHLQIIKRKNREYIALTDEPHREGVKPCANYMYESLCNSIYSKIICVVLTGMGADGTEGILKLKEKKRISVIIQNKETCVVYGMPGSISRQQIEYTELPIEQISNEIIRQTGVNQNGC